MRTSVLVSCSFLVAFAGTLIATSISSRALAEGCPKERRKVCIEETLGGHTLKHSAFTNECLAAKFGGKILNEGDCSH